MSLPKEPRQLMINLMYLVLTALLAMNVSKEIINAFRIVDNSIVKSNANIDNKNASTIINFDEKLNDPKIKANQEKYEKVKMAREIATQADDITKKIIAELNGYREEIIKRAGGLNAEGKIEKDDDLEAASSFMVTENNGNKMKDNLEKFRNDLAKLIDQLPKDMRMSADDKSFENKLPIHFDNPTDGRNWAQANFEMVPAVAAVTLVDKFKNDVKNSQTAVFDELWAAALGEVRTKSVSFSKYGILAAADNAYVLPGQKVTVTAMLGAFNDGADGLKISINGTPITPKEGVATYTTTSSKDGANSVVVRAEYFDKNGNGGLGKWETVAPYTLNYYVGKPQATVSIDKLNVFFKGLDNPITVSASGVQMRDVVVTSTGEVTLKADPSGLGKYFVQVNQLGTTKINIKGKRSDGTYEDFGTTTYRLARVPDPVAMIANKKSGTCSVSEMKQQLAVFAKLEDFFYDVKWTVLSYRLVRVPKRGEMEAPIEVGSQFFNDHRGSADVRAMANRLQVGDRIFFEEIKAVGPDKSDVRKLPSMSFLLNN